MKMSVSSVAAMDAGYGNFKILGAAIAAPEDHHNAFLLPIGAADLAKAPRLVNGQAQLHGGEVVLLPDGRRWVGGIDPLFLEGFARQTHKDYPLTDEYLALCYAGLAKLAAAGHSNIKLLVTGIPCDQYASAGRGFRRKLAGRFIGSLEVSPGVHVHVKKCFVLAQPVGSYCALCAEEQVLPEDARLVKSEETLVLVIDAGFYSTDWCLMRDSTMVPGSPHSTKLATSTILEAAAARISKDHGRVPLSVEKLDSAFRGGKEMLQLGKVCVDYRPYIEVAGDETAMAAMAEITSSVRMLKDVLPVVLLTGGAASLFERAATHAFHASAVRIIANPVMANVRGYLGFGLSYVRPVAA